MASKEVPNPISTRSERSDARENRRRLLDAAQNLFAAQGVAATNMKQIAEAARVGKGTLYRHFADKCELCRALLDNDVAEFQTRVGAQIADRQQTPSALARLELLIGERVQLTEKHLSLFAAIEEAASGASHQERKFRSPFSHWTHLQIVALLDEAVVQGEAAPLDAAFVADAILAALSPALVSYQRSLAGYNLERIGAGMRWLFIDGLRPQR